MIPKAPFKSSGLILLHLVVALEIRGTCLVFLSGGFLGLTCTVPPGLSRCREDVSPTRLGAASNCSDQGVQQVQVPTGAAGLGGTAA